MSFVFSKVFWFLAQPGNLFFILLTLAILLLWTRYRRLGRRLLAVLLVFGAAVAVLPLGQWLILPLENRFRQPTPMPSRIDGIVVLGGAVDPLVSRARGQPAVNGNAERLVAFAELSRKYPTAKLIFTGGSSSLFRQNIKEAEAARVFLKQLGLDTSRVRFEDRSRNTAENAVNTYALVKPRLGSVWLLVTSARHMPRAYGLYRGAGWRISPYPVDYLSDGRYSLRLGFNFAGGLSAMGAGLKEWIGLSYSYLGGRTSRWFPGPE
ncbi:MAG: YdcF family protein [Alphaproteobacteria bacterium]